MRDNNILREKLLLPSTRTPTLQNTSIVEPYPAYRNLMGKKKRKSCYFFYYSFIFRDKCISYYHLIQQADSCKSVYRLYTEKYCI